ncbi:MAG: anthranilate phosphoribosyltransferase family protein [Spirulinaceae cyanobacterium SM2_1_0]|nr:anthranilate phosphoribosyltransferase family protein [Spirulinaceae cyanobacterium SM2_1_0]
MSQQFRELLQKVGNGAHTKQNLSRQEAAIAARHLLEQEATPAQIGAFLIAHRIKRPTSAELAGMLDTYAELGPQVPALPATEPPVIVMSTPYDGRSRTAPVTPLSALILATAGLPVLLHGGDSAPTKHGLPLNDLLVGLGLDFRTLSLTQLQTVLTTSKLGFVYTPHHFPQADALMTYREEIGKRPPLATLELIWLPYAGLCRAVAGYVHPPTEPLLRQALAQRGITDVVLVKGLEGSCDLPRARTAIATVSQSRIPGVGDYLKLHPRDYGFAGEDLPSLPLPELLTQMEAVLRGEAVELLPAALWNAGFYLWQFGGAASLAAGIDQAKTWLAAGRVVEQRREIQQAIAACHELSRTPPPHHSP